MTAKLIHYIRFSLYNSLEIAVLRVWKTQGISFCQICKHPGIAIRSLPFSHISFVVFLKLLQIKLRPLKPNTHRRRRSTVELSHVGCVYGICN